MILNPPLGKGTFQHQPNLRLFYFSSQKGAYGEVRKAVHKATGQLRAVKIMYMGDLEESEKANFENEVEICRNLVSIF